MVLCSIIIPVYNAEKTIERCLNSILGCSFGDYEIVLVDDGSNDGSLQICKEYAEKHLHIKLFSFSNAGAGAARNQGLKYALGKYIMFCDADDWYDTESLNHLFLVMDYVLAENDLVCFDYQGRYKNLTENVHHISDNKISQLTDGEKYQIVSSSRLSSEFSVVVWNKVFKSEIINYNSIAFPERNVLNNQDDWGEDLIFVAQYLMCCNKIFTSSSWVIFINSRVPFGKSETKYYSTTRVLQMTKMLQFFQNSNVWSNRFSFKQFSKVYIYNMHNYFYEVIYNQGIVYLRKQILEYSDSKYIISLLKLGLKQINSFSPSNWGVFGLKEYKYFLQYIVDGNMFMFKVKNKLLYTAKRRQLFNENENGV